MTGSIALDTVIGLIFIFLLYSLLATVICEILAAELGLRARNLHLAIRRMLEDNPTTSGLKLIAFFKHIGSVFYNFFWHPQGPATCIFYHLPVIKYLGRNSYNSKPSYISKQNFSKAIIEMARRYGGDNGKTDLEKVQNVLSGSVLYEGVLNEIKEIINEEARVELMDPKKEIDFSAVKKRITDLVNSKSVKKPNDEAQKKLLLRIENLLSYHGFFLKVKHFFNQKKCDKVIFYKIDQILNVFGYETRSHLQSLLKDANNDIDKFRLLLEQWFDDTMERAASWYKQKVQFILFLVGFIFALAFNANTVEISRRLSVDTDAREKLVNMATSYSNHSSNNPQTVSSLDAALKGKVDSVWISKLDTLERMRASLQKDIDGAGSILGTGWNLPDSLQLLSMDDLKKGVKADSAYHSRLNHLIKSHKGISKIDSIETGVKNKKKFIILIPAHLNPVLALKSLDEKNYEGYEKSNIRLSPVPYYTMAFKTGFWGYLITAIAISLGAPFWFDLLNKLVQLRGSIKTPSKEPNASGNDQDNK
jgi:hypothetical protein